MLRKLFGVDDEIVIITGANGQLGSEYARGFLECGARVVGLDLASSPVSDELTKEYPERFVFSSCNVTSREDLDATLELTQSKYGAPSVLINNAGIDSPPDAPKEECGPFETYPDESWDRVMDVNVRGVYLACKVFGTVMAATGRGSIINVSSIYGVVSPDQNIYNYRRARGEVFYKPVAYAVSKSALLNLTRYLAVYWAKHGVRVNTLVIAGVENNQDEEFVKAYQARIPIGRMAHKKEYIGATLFLAGSASSYMTGAQLVIDGGWTAI